MFDPTDLDSMISMPDWKYYMLKGSWPWEDVGDDDDDDDDEDDDD